MTVSRPRLEFITGLIYSPPDRVVIGGRSGSNRLKFQGNDKFPLRKTPKLQLTASKVIAKTL